METRSEGDDHDGRQKGGMDSTLVAIEWGLLGGRWSSNTGGTETGSGRSEMDANYTRCLSQPHSRDGYVG